VNFNAAAAWRQEPATIAAAFLLLVAIILGGGGADGPVTGGIVEALAALTLAAIAAMHFSGRPLPPEAKGPVWFIAATLLLILFQLVPLPPSLWMVLPGRETALSVSQLIGRSGEWRPLSLDPESTRQHAAALLVPAAMLLAAIGASHRGLLLLNRTLIVGALLSALLGALQIALGSPPSLFLYGHTFPGIASGFFANPNHQAELMLAGLIATGLMIRLEPPQVRIRRAGGERMVHLGWLLFPIFMALAVAAQSRAGLILLVPATAASAIIANRRKGTGKWLIAFFALVAALVIIVAFTPGSLERALHLKSTVTEGRIVLLPDVIYTLNQYWPWGSGLGTFVPVFQANENLDFVQTAWVNHAHNDLLEWLLETGLPGAILLAAAIAALLWRVVRLLLSRAATDPAPALAGLAILLLLLVHSLVDYPLRMRSLAAVAALAIAFIFSRSQQRPASDPSASKSRRRKGFSRVGSALPARRPRAGPLR
jgi:O-antigen ligase